MVFQFIYVHKKGLCLPGDLSLLAMIPRLVMAFTLSSYAEYSNLQINGPTFPNNRCDYYH